MSPAVPTARPTAAVPSPGVRDRPTARSPAVAPGVGDRPRADPGRRGPAARPLIGAGVSAPLFIGLPSVQDAVRSSAAA